MRQSRSGPELENKFASNNECETIKQLSSMITNCTRDCTCCGGVDTALSAVAWTLHLLRWRGHCTRCGGVDMAWKALAAVTEQLENRGHTFS